MNSLDSHAKSSLSRREFFSGTLAAAAATSLASLTSVGAEPVAPAVPPAQFERKIKMGVVGNGGRGAWVAGLFRKHGGFEMHAVADYFPEVADKCGEALGVEKARRFSTLSGYKQLLESGVEAVVLEVPPYFFPEQARAAVEAGLHVYMAKPVAVDVPGALQILSAGKQAAEKQRCFMVDYQMPTDPANQEVLKRLRAEGGIGKIAQIMTTGFSNAYSDPPKTANLESRLQKLIWTNDIAIGCDFIGNYDIHAIDVALWVVGWLPVAAVGNSRVFRPNPHGDSHDVCSVVFEYPDGLVHNHVGQALTNLTTGGLACRVCGLTGNALLPYSGKAQMRSTDDAYEAPVQNLYEAGVVRNIATFYKNVTGGHYQNETVQRSVDGVLVCILGREAAARRTRLTLDEVIKENKRLELDLTGLKT